MKRQIFQILCITFFFVIFGYFFGDEYWNYKQQGENQVQYKNIVGVEVSDFSLEDIGDFGGNIELYHTPYLGLLDQIVDEIDSAQQKIYVEVYIFTETRMRDAIIRAYNRGVEVKILLENNPYKAPYLNDKHYQTFQDAGIDVRWSDPLNYSLNHSKLLIIDSTSYISTGNFSYSLFKYNRDFLVSFSGSDFTETLEQLFIQDFTHKNIGIYHENLVLSPDYSRNKMTTLIGNAQESIDFYFPYMQDSDFEEALFVAGNKGVKLRGIVEKNFYKENDDIVEDFSKHNVTLFPLDGNKLHAKAILVDDTYLYIGSINFSSYSFDHNREIGVIIFDSKVIEKFKKVFDSDAEM